MVDFHRVLAWDKLAEVCNQYLVKGMALYIEGRLANHSFDDKEGNKHYRTEIVTDELNILTWKKTKSGDQQIGIEAVAGVQEEERELVAA